MVKNLSVAEKYKVSFISLLPFLLISFGLAWGILGLFIFLPDQMTPVFGELTGQHPLFFLSVYAPAIAAFVVIAYNGGINGGLMLIGLLILVITPWSMAKLRRIV